MLHAWLFLNCYGLVLIACFFLICIWCELLCSRFRAEGKAALDDTYVVIIMALLLNAVASAILFGSRTADSVTAAGDWVPPVGNNLTGNLILLGSCLIFVAKAILVFASGAGVRKAWRFPFFLAVCMSYSIGTIVAMDRGWISYA